jgi:hypothetical protein
VLHLREAVRANLRRRRQLRAVPLERQLPHERALARQHLGHHAPQLRRLGLGLAEAALCLDELGAKRGAASGLRAFGAWGGGDAAPLIEAGGPWAEAEGAPAALLPTAPMLPEGAQRLSLFSRALLSAHLDAVEAAVFGAEGS